MRSLYRQLHSVENTNRAAVRPAAHVNVSCDGAEYTNDDIGPRATVVPVRDFTPVVPCSLTDVDRPEYEVIDNPINILGAVMEQQIPVVTNNDFDSFIAAFNKRSNFLAEEDDDVADSVFHRSMELIEALPQIHEPWDENAVDRERWMEKFDQAKRDRMQLAYENIDELDTQQLGVKTLSVKREVLLKRGDPEWAPRIIYAGTDAFNSVTGPPSMVVMERACHLFRHDQHAVKFAGLTVDFAYKLNDVAISQFVTSPHCGDQYLEGDFSRNDREQRKRVALIYDAWLKKLNMPEWFRDLLIALEQYKVVSYIHGLKAWLSYQLATGTTSTTPRNSLYNLTMFGVACDYQKVPRGLAMILGDDILASVVGVFSIAIWVKTVSLFKMVLKAMLVELNGQSTFLSRRFITQGELPCMLPKLGKALARFNVKAVKNPAVSDSQYMAGKALSYAYEFRHCPVISSAFIARYESEDNNFFQDNSDFTWFARTSGLDTPEKLLHAITHERVLIDIDTFSDWIAEFYGLYLDELEDLLNCYVRSNVFDTVDEPLYELLEKDM